MKESSTHIQMLFSMKPLSIYKQPPLLFASLSKPLLHNNDKGLFKERRLIKYSSSFNSCCRVHALKEDPKQYEIDPEKAKEALKKLDQKIQSISNREVSSPKLKGILSFSFFLIYYSRYLNSKLCIGMRNRVNCVMYYGMDGVAVK